MGDLRVVKDLFAFAVESGLECERRGAVSEEDETALGAGEAQRELDHCAENVLEDTGVVEALRCLEKE